MNISIAILLYLCRYTDGSNLFAPLTHLQGKEIFLAVNDKSYRFNTSLTLISAIDNLLPGHASTSLIPFGSSHLVKANMGADLLTDAKLQYINVNTNTVDLSFTNFTQDGWVVTHVMVYKNATTEKVVIPVNFGDTLVITEDYQVIISGGLTRAFIDGKDLVVVHADNTMTVSNVVRAKFSIKII